MLYLILYIVIALATVVYSVKIGAEDGNLVDFVLDVALGAAWPITWIAYILMEYEIRRDE